jgi:hypothetical protein
MDVFLWTTKSIIIAKQNYMAFNIQILYMILQIWVGLGRHNNFEDLIYLNHDVRKTNYSDEVFFSLQQFSFHDELKMILNEIKLAICQKSKYKHHIFIWIVLLCNLAFEDLIINYL